MFDVSVDSLEDSIRKCEAHGSQVAKPIFAPVSFWGLSGGRIGAGRDAHRAPRMAGGRWAHISRLASGVIASSRASPQLVGAVHRLAMHADALICR